MRAMLLCLALTGCFVDGTPYEPCPDLVIYASVKDSVALDSIDYDPCGE